MRTTIDIDDDVLMAVKERARRQKRSAGEVLSEIARRALTGGERQGSEVSDGGAFYGFEPLPRRGALVSNQVIDRLRDEDGE